MPARTYSGPAPSRRTITQPLVQQQRIYDQNVASQQQKVDEANAAERAAAEEAAAKGETYVPLEAMRRWDPNTGSFFISYVATDESGVSSAVGRTDLGGGYIPNQNSYGQNPNAPAMNDPKNPMGQIDQSAYDRLRKAGFTDQQARERIASQRAPAASTASNTGRGGSFDAAGMFRPGSATDPSPQRVQAQQLAKEIRSLDPASMVKGTGANGMPHETQLEFEQRKTMAAQRRTALMEQLRLLQEAARNQQSASAAADAVTGQPTMDPAAPPPSPGAAPLPAPAVPGAPAAPAAPAPAAPAPGTPDGQLWTTVQNIVAQGIGNPEEIAALLNLRARNTPGMPEVTTEQIEAILAQLGGTPGSPSPSSADPNDPLARIGVTAQTTLDNQLAIADENPYDPSSAIEAARVDVARELAVADAVEAFRKEQALEKQRASLQFNDRAAELARIENTKAILDQEKSNAENEVKSRRRINKLSGGHDFSGMNWVQKNVQDGLDAVNYLRSKAANMEGQFGDTAISIINQYGLDLEGARVEKKQSYATAYSSYTTSLRDIEKEMNADATSRRQMRFDAHKEYSDTLTQLDFKYGDHLNDMRLKAYDRMTQLEKLRVQQQNSQVSNAIRMLALSTKKGIAFSPDAMANFERLVAPDLPPGWMRRSAGAGGAGGGAGGAANYKHWTPEGLQAAITWVSSQPGRSMTDLSPKDQEWLVPIAGGAGGGGTRGGAAPGGSVLGEGLQYVGGPAISETPQGGDPFAFERPRDTSTPSAIREYDELISRDPSLAGVMSLTDYLNTKSYGTLYGLNSALRNRPTETTQTTIIQQVGDDDAFIDDLINSESFDLSDE